MVDIHCKSVRSYNMSRIKSKNTKPELIVRKFLFSNGLRYRIHNTELPGKPDIKLTKYKTLVNINGCFWHGHRGCRYFVLPKSRIKFWTDKIIKNRERDKRNLKVLRKIGWNVITVFECELKENKDKTLNNILSGIKKMNLNKNV
ncbi:MAG: DNA mismatch endonuclease Vsr [Ignavibacteria bacterium]|nr:DNA mismatch endonuclease Vsr [Ignavibacteria bacterium]